MDRQSFYGNVDEYIRLFSPDIRNKLEGLRAAIRSAAPEAEEKIAYRMPAYAQNGPLVYFAAFRSHIGFYPTAEGIEAFREELKGYKTSKGAVQFPLDQPLPLELITKIVEYKIRRNLSKTKR